MKDRATVQRMADAVAIVPGAALAFLFGAAARLRPAAKPLHPSGRLTSATVRGIGLSPTVGVAWIDEPGMSRGEARLSRAAGLPAGLPDVHGLALRLPLPGGHGDLLLATTGMGVPGRFVLRPTRDATPRCYTTLLPYRTTTGPLLLAAVPRDPEGRVLELSCASPLGRWRSFATVELEDLDAGDVTGDSSVSFDPVLNKISGLDCYPWVARLREGAYRASRRARGDRRRRP